MSGHYTVDLINLEMCSLHDVSTDQQNHRRSLSAEEKQSYIQAVQCLHELPPKLKQDFDGVHSRYDDIVCYLSHLRFRSFSNIRFRLPTT